MTSNQSYRCGAGRDEIKRESLSEKRDLCKLLSLRRQITKTSPATKKLSSCSFKQFSLCHSSLEKRSPSRPASTEQASGIKPPLQTRVAESALYEWVLRVINRLLED